MAHLEEDDDILTQAPVTRDHPERSSWLGDQETRG